MWINITKDVFEKSDFKGLNYLYQILTHSPSASKPRYNIVIDVENVKDTENFKKLSEIESSLEEILNIEYAYYQFSGESLNYKISFKKADAHFNIEEAILFFNQPVSIILENNKNDAEFVLAIIKFWGQNSGYNKAKEHIDNAWLKFENAGGCTNIPNFLEGFLRQFKSIAKRNNKSLLSYFRGVIIIDSDKEFENQAIKIEHESILTKIQALGLDVIGVINRDNGKIENNNARVHILEKRMMENYIPKNVFGEILRQVDRSSDQDLKDWLNAYVNLSSVEQLDFINIPDGTLNGVKSPIPDELQQLWSPLAGNFKKLDKGFNFKGFDSEGKINNSKHFNVKNELPKWFRKEIVTKANLEERDGKGELPKILEKIVDLL